MYIRYIVTKNIDDPRFLNKAVIITIEDQIKPDGSAANPTSRRSEMRTKSTPQMGSRERLLHLPSPTADLHSLPSPPIQQATRQHRFPNPNNIIQCLPDAKPHNLDTHLQQTHSSNATKAHKKG
ncbi:hypothetical protein HYC85_029785 [Camellia sinensis]|uniref:Uncharacterized protein n=1 Tax=Camellia sinensis TaxID=4442 RepID=A0A7J7G2T5_CAMSI|nr:hypothetical protein HYC85_029785 [Camellia sinensis]